ncbi:CBS domain-containing protein [Candidatus Magnetomoraceae bacterium gMMP-15]
MECNEIMNPVKIHLFAEDPSSKAIDFMNKKHIGLVPVVNRDNVFVGLLSGDRIIHFILPRTISMMRGKQYAGYLRESCEELKERLDELCQHPIGDLVDSNVMVAYPDTGVIDAMLIISEKQYVVPIVERETNKLVGAISFFTILNALKGKE